jgi:hypothetical protein
MRETPMRFPFNCSGLLMSGLARMLWVSRLLMPPIMTGSLLPATKGRVMLAAPITATSLSPDRMAATAGAPGVTKTRGISKSYFLKRPASAAIHG